MKELKIELNQDYKQFKNGFNQILKGDLIILSGINGSGKTQLIDILDKQSTDFPINEQKRNKIDCNILIDDNVLKNADISRRSFKDNINIENIKVPEPKNILWDKEQAWNCYSNHSYWTNNSENYSKAKSIIQKILSENVFFSDPKLNWSKPNNTEIDITEEEFKKLLPDNFIWESDDLFSNKIDKLFYEFAAKRQDKKAVLGEKNGGFKNKEYIKDAPWTILNEIFKKLKFNYRFKEDYEFETPNFKEPINLFSVDSSGKLDTNFSRLLSSLSEGEKSIISLTFALLNEKRRPIEKLLLLDEFDNTLNPSLIEALFKVLDEYFISKGVTVVMTTHSPVTISLAPENATFYELFRQDNESPKILQVQKEEYTELKIANKEFYDKILDQQSRIEELKEKVEQNNKMLTANKILFVEDEYTQIYKIAWLKLHGYSPTEENLETLFTSNASFDIFSKANKDSLKGFLSNPFMDEWKNKKIVGLFDFDDAYNCFKSLKVKKQDDWTKEMGDENSGLYKNRNDYNNIYAMMLPVPEYRKAIASKEYSTRRLEVELLFKDEDIEKIYGNQEYSMEPIIGEIQIPKISNKKNFWVKAINIPKESFEGFKPLFERIDELLEIKYV